MSDKITWDFMMVYLCGPIDYAKDRGVKWREDITPKLIEIGFKESNILNPCNKPVGSYGRNLSEEQRISKEFRDKKDWGGLESLMKQIIKVDLRMVDKSDILIVNLSDCDRIVGSVHEIIAARYQHKPVYLIDNKGIENVSGWLIGLVGHSRIFSSVEDALAAIRRVKEGGPECAKDTKDFLVFDFAKREMDHSG